ncbi:MAG: thiol:disulfide interchange protein [Hyphomicrobiaceae bacterium]|nr:MAG: thiol:disulfide interchange protein [Hyphomicrobiaceae bacterium]
MHSTTKTRLPRIAARAGCAAIAALALLAGPTAVLAASPPAQELVKAALLAEPAAVKAGEPFWVGVRLTMKEHWHTYWRNPGDSGEATTIRWQLPPGFAAGPTVWPAPSRIPVAHLANYGYSGEAMLLTRITPPAALDASAPLTLKADVSWLVCEKECIPGEASLSLVLPVAAGAISAQPAPETKAAFDAARAATPQPSPWTAKVDVRRDGLTLRVAAKGLKAEGIRSALYFPFSETLIAHAAPQPFEISDAGLSLRLTASAALATGTPKDAGGLLVVEEAMGAATVRHAFELTQVAVGAGPADTAEAASPLTVLQAALAAFAGGLILNLMPCVFPVLSIKVLGLIKHAGQSPAHVRMHGLSYTAGVVAAFLALAGALLTVRAAGAEVGWGFQLQSPVVVALLAYVLFAMGLSLSGVYHFGGALQGLGSGLAQRSGLSGSFFTGVLAVVVATPCTAPFMGTALGFAMTQPAIVGLAVFLALGLGLALPFLILTLAPRLVARLPRPGAWMETLKQALAFPIYATVAWLVWVLGQQVGPTGLFAALFGLVLVALAAWSFSVSQTAGSIGRRVAASLTIASLAAAGLAVAGLEQDRALSADTAQPASASGVEVFSQRRLDELRAANRPVFVNLTAAWCITCLVNERAVLATGAVKAAFAGKNIAYLKGDWTNRNPEITRVLERHGRSGVPLYLLYAGTGEPVVLPQILTSAIVLDEIARVADAGLQRRAEIRVPSPSATKE